MVDRKSDAQKVVSPKEVALKMKLEYSRGIKDSLTRDLEAVTELCRMLEKPTVDTNVFIREVANVIMKDFAIESVAIGVKDHIDSRFKYRTVMGLEKDVADGFKDLSYSREELLEPSNYPAYDISDRTKLFLAEDHPYAAGEEFTYRRPGLIGMKRRTLTESLEADYMDFFFNGPDSDYLGFIEVSGTRLRKLPDAVTIKWIELIATMLGIALQKAK
jgi:hypothetical protein